MATRYIAGGPGILRFCFVGFVGLALLGAGCAGGDTTPDPGGGGEGGSGGDPTSASSSGTGAGGAGGGGMGGSGGGMGGSGGAGGSGGVGGSGGSGSNVLYPLAAGATWTYQVSKVSVGEMCDPGTHTTEIVATSQLGGREAFEVDSFCTGIQGTYFLANDAGDQVDRYEGAAWALFLDPTLKTGQQWMNSDGTFTWTSEGTVSVPAGTFSDCWKAQESFIEGENYTIYCRGIGPVRIFRAVGFAGSGFDAKLTQSSLIP